MPERRDKNDVRILRMHDDRADVAAVFQADIPPIAAAIDGLINAVAIGDIAAERGLAGAGVDRVVIARRDRDRADRRRGMLLVEHRLPVGAAVGRFPHAACDRAEIISVRLTRDAFDRDRASAAERSDLAPLHAAPELFVELTLLLRPWIQRASSRSCSILPRQALRPACLIWSASFFSDWLRLCSLGQRLVRKPWRRLRVRVGRP